MKAFSSAERLAGEVKSQMDKRDGLRKRGKGFANVASIVRRELSKLTRIVGELEEKLVKWSAAVR